MFNIFLMDKIWKKCSHSQDSHCSGAQKLKSNKELIANAKNF
jgi:hypothetical protein